MTNDELERKVNLRRITHAINNISMAIDGLWVVETEALACEDPLSETMSANIAGEVFRLRNALGSLDKVRESLGRERMPIEFSEERLLNNEWMDLDTEVRVPMGELGDDEPTPNLDERVETSAKEQGVTSYCSEWDRRDAERRFTHHKPKPNQVNACETIRRAGMDIALTILGLCPATHERDRAIEAVDMAVMWANASVARHWS